jgi:PPM family protein phosphatase
MISVRKHEHRHSEQQRDCDLDFMIRIECAVAATRGARDYQEDCAAFWPDGGSPIFVQAQSANATSTHGFAVLADGMGGHKGGALASRILCDRFLETVTASQASILERLSDGLDAANAALADKIAASPTLSGMGSTLIGVAISNDGLSWISVGDSPLFFFRRGQVAVLNEDHSLAPELDRLVAEGKLTSAEARRDSRRHMLRSAVTGDEIDLIDLSSSPVAVEAGDFIVLASDGIGTLEKPEIARIIQGYAADGPDVVARALIRAVEAVREPHQDNATVLVVQIS